MPITLSDLKIYLSKVGGGVQADPNDSFGGARSTTELVDNTLDNLFDKVTGDEALAGLTDYRCVYFRNEHASLTWEAVKLWLSQLTTSTDDELAIGLGSSGKNGTEQRPANDVTAPGSVTFSSPVTKGTGLTMGDLTPNDFYPVWIRRTVTAAAAAINSNSAKIKAEGDTAA